MTQKAHLKWIETYFHPNGLSCSHCGASFNLARWFRKTKQSDLDVYRCMACNGIYNLYSQTAFQGRHFKPEQVIQFIQGIRQQKPTTQLARVLNISRTTATEIRQQLQPIIEKEQRTFLFDDLDTHVAQIH